MGMVGVAELDDVIADMVRGTGELVAHGVVEPATQGFAPLLPFAHANIRGKTAGHGIEVAHVQRQRILRGELANFIQRLETVNARQ